MRWSPSGAAERSREKFLIYPLALWGERGSGSLQPSPVVSLQSQSGPGSPDHRMAELCLLTFGVERMDRVPMPQSMQA